jgi:hypothetical protein
MFHSGFAKRFRSPWRRTGAVVVALAIAAVAIIPVSVVVADREEAEFPLVINNALLLPCLAEHPDDPRRQPTATVSVERGELNDTLRLRLRNIKPNLNFDLFTVQRSNKLASGAPDTSFNGSFGMAWYQTDVHANENGNADVTIKTILLDQIFGFDPDVSLAPTNTFHVGFWFNNPDDAAPCGFPTVTPFNGDHHAGVLAMISTPDAATNLGPLCRNPDTSVTPVRCNP